jgi:hypothetical protein
MVGMDSIVVSEIPPPTFEETYNELLNYVDLLEPLLEQFESMGIEERKESIMVEEEKEVEKVKMLSDNIKEPLLNLDKCSLNELINILQSSANDPSFIVPRGCLFLQHPKIEKTVHPPLPKKEPKPS